MNNERNRSWRRFKKQVKCNKGMGCLEIGIKPEKNWKMLWSRTTKLMRAKQLGFEYPRVKLDQRNIEE